MTIITCHYTDPPHEHVYPEGWEFGGANGSDPRADPRWEPNTFTYWNDDATIAWITQTPLCDDQAIDEFTKVAAMGSGFRPRWLQVKRPDGTEEMLPWVYDKETDTVTFKESNASQGISE